MEAPRPTAGKWVARSVYLLALAVLLGVGWWAWPGEAPEPPIAVNAPGAAPSIPRQVAPPSPRLDDAAPEVKAEPARPLPPTPAVAPLAALPRPPKPSLPPEVLAREATLLERARGQAQSDPKAAWDSLVELRESFPDGALGRDADLVRVEVLLRLGRREEAQTLGHQLIAADRRGVLGRTVQQLLSRVRPN